jgi:hypothetical protein
VREDCLLGKLRTIVLQRSGLWEVCTSVLVNAGHAQTRRIAPNDAFLNGPGHTRSNVESL